MKEKILGLRNLNYELDLFNSKKRFAVYRNTNNNNMIIFSYDKTCDIDSVCGAIRDKAYDYLINEMNTNNNLLVYWTQVEGTTSDYIIFYDVNNDDLLLSISQNMSREYMNSLIKEDNAPCYKYTQVKDDVRSKLEATIG
jgi:hypothetical protein